MSRSVNQIISRVPAGVDYDDRVNAAIDAHIQEIEATQKERIRKLTQTVKDLAQQVDWLVPFLDKKAKESGDVSGMQLNAMQASRNAKQLLNFYEATDAAKASELARS